MTRKRINRKVLCSGLMVLLVCNLSGCMLLPKEDVERKVTYVRADQLKEYTFVSPERMDLEKQVEITCQYQQQVQENLRFAADNQIINQVLVKEGDIVKKGEILATVKAEDNSARIDEMKSNIEQLEKSVQLEKMSAEFQKKQLALDYKYKKLTKTEYNKQLAAIANNLKASLKDKENQIYIMKLRVEELEKLDAQTKIVAPMDGMISYVKNDLLNNFSRKDLVVIKMIYPEKCAFAIYKTDDSSFLEEGKEYSVDVSGNNYKGKILPINKEENYLYLKLTDKPTDLEVGSLGIIRHTVESKKNVLVLATNVIHEGDNYHFVYIEDEDRIKRIKKVTVGLQTKEYTEIVSGLTENDKIIQE